MYYYMNMTPISKIYVIQYGLSIYINVIGYINTIYILTRYINMKYKRNNYN